MSVGDKNNQLDGWINDLLNREIINTPALLIDTTEIKRILDLFEKYIPQVKLFYAIKANNTPELLKFLNSQGMAFDVASYKEIKQIQEIGIKPRNVILSNPIKTQQTIKAIFDAGITLITVDNPLDLRALYDEKVRRGAPYNVDIFVRVKTPSKDVQINLNSKFGASEDEALHLLEQARNYGFNPRGVQFHVGTQSWNVENYAYCIEHSLRIFDRAKSELNIKCDTINIGGGYPDPIMAQKVGGLDTFFSKLATAIKPAVDRALNLIAEPGRVCVSSACSAVCTVVGKSVRNGTPWIYLDDGAYGLFSGKFFDHKEFQFSVLRKDSSSSKQSNEPELIPYVVAGPTCDSIDVISESILLRADLTVGDILVSHNMGAYSLTTGNHFNGFGEIFTYLGSPKEELSTASATDLKETRIEYKKAVNS